MPVPLSPIISTVAFVGAAVSTSEAAERIAGDLPVQLQASTSACRARMSATDYIACPSCGRTLFNIQDTLLEIKAATSHLTHLKIAVMGCIVNGPGEMADADYGYVGSGKGKISLYRNKEIVKKNIPQQNAVEELLHLIKTNGDWHDRS